MKKKISYYVIGGQKVMIVNILGHRYRLHGLALALYIIAWCIGRIVAAALLILGFLLAAYSPYIISWMTA